MGGTEEGVDGAGETKDRGKWTNPLDFFVSSLGYAVGLGNIWRFPFLCFKHGGGSFLISYLIMVVFAGMPSLFLEMALGQLGGVSPIKLFGRISPYLKGLGFAMVTLGLLFSLFYNVVVSWALWYLASAFTKCPMRWTHCGSSFNTENCIPISEVGKNNHEEGTSSVEEYFHEFVLGGSFSSWEAYGSPRIHSFVCITLAWMIVGFMSMNGIKTSGKVAYGTTLFPYFVLTILGINALTLPGAWNGIYYYLMPKWDRLLSFDIWIDAATQVIFTLGVACGCVITLSSYNSSNRNCQLDAVLICILNAATSIFSGFVVFAILGYMAGERGVELREVVEGGPGLAFITYPEVLAKVSYSKVCTGLFFFMLINLAVGSILGVFETILSTITDQWPTLREKKLLIDAGICLSMICLSIPFTAPGGIHLFTLFNWVIPSWNLLLIILLEIIGVGWIYGAGKFIEDIRTQLNIKVNFALEILWTCCWKFITPLILLCLLVQFWRNYGGVQYNGYVYPGGIQILGYVLTGLTVIWIPIFALIALVRKLSNKSPETEPQLVERKPSYGGVEASAESNF